MNLLTKKQKIAVLGAFLYTLIMSVAMYISFHINGVEYGEPNMVDTLWYFEIILSLFAIVITVRYFSWKEVGFDKINKKQILWIVPLFLLLILIWGGIFNFLLNNEASTEQIKLFSLVGFTTLLVGFSEELMYRGILFSAFLNNKKSGKIKAVFISALGFSLLHAINFLAGLPLGALIDQLIFTFIFGVLFALLKLRIKNIIPFIIYHWLWDFALIGAVVIGYYETFSDYSAFLEFILIVILLFLLLKEKRNIPKGKTFNVE